MKNKSVLLFVILLGIGIIAFVSLRFPNQTKVPAQSQQKSNSSVLYQQQKDERGSVVIEVTPISLATEKNTSFTLSFTTHSGDLNYDIVAIAKLADNKGNIYNPISWTGGKGGHHISGTLTFAKLSQEASAVTLTIPGIDNFDRVFSWDLE
ncbi:MAG: hypothetical protein AAB922_00350 [Patescibacteria group bacterium]